MPISGDVLTGQVVFSSSEDGFPFAAQELRDAFGRQLRIERLGPDIGVIESASITVNQVSAACFRRPIAYVRHLTAHRQRVPRDDASQLETVAGAAVAVVLTASIGPDIAVQAWVSGSPRIGYSAGELAGRIATDLEQHGLSVARGGQQYVLSSCITAKGVVLGLNRRSDSLSDWPGGRVRLGKGENRVSRAEFKLEELFGLFPLDLPEHGTAIDLGAAPGGWTRILRQQGLQVWAIDPGEMAPQLLADPAVHHQRTTAGEFFRSTQMLFDIAVNDMRMDPMMSASVMADAARRLRPGAYAVVTLKTGLNQPVVTMRRCLDVLRREYEILFARQLHHNRHELTVVARRLSRP